MKTPQVSSSSRLAINPFSIASIFLVATLASCSGGGGGGSSVAATSVTGTVIDAPVDGATITITQNAPIGQPGAITLGTTTGDSNGHYSLNSIPIPETTASIYASSQGGTVYGQENPNILLTAYLGQGQALAAAGSDLHEENDPDLAVSQVTTAAVAIASDGGRNYQISGYGATLAADQTQLIELASEIMCQVDGGDSLPAGENTLGFVNSLVAQNPPTPTTDYLTVNAAFSSSSCPNLTTYMTMLTTSGDWDAELQGGDNPVASLNISAGNYSLQGLVLNSGIQEETSSTIGTPGTPAVTPFTISFRIASDGSVSQPTGSANILSVTSGSNVTGQILTLDLSDSSGNTYTLKGTLKLLPATWHSASTEAYVFQGGGSDTTSSNSITLVNMDGVLYQGNDSPLWRDFGPIDGQENISCHNGGFKLRGTFPSSESVPVFPICLSSQSSTTLQLTNISDGQNENRDDVSSQSSPPSTISASLSNSVQYPFIMSGTITLGSSSTHTIFYILGANGAFFTSYSSTPSTPPCTLTTVCGTGDTAGSAFFSGNILALPKMDN